MSTLRKVCVWALPFPPEGIDLSMGDSPNAYFSTDCLMNE